MTVTADDGVPLAGTLTLPPGPGPHPAALLLHGSGPLDRDGNTPKLRVNLGPAVAASLAEQGVATLRYDRRGIGRTPGDWRAAGFAGNRADSAAAVRALAALPEVCRGAVAVVGHSEGALHAMALAGRDDVRAVALLAGYARSGEEALKWQARSILQTMPAPARLLRRPLAAVGKRLLARIKGTRADVVRLAGMPVNARWMRENLAHNSRKDLAAARAAVLAVTGDADLQVDPADLDVIRRLVPGGAEIHRPARLTHLLRRDCGHRARRSYRSLLREPVDPGVLALVTTWLARRLDVAPRQLATEGRSVSPERRTTDEER